MIWEAIEGFKEEENWGKPLMVNGLLLLLLSAIRKEYKKVDPSASFIIHCAYAEKGHSNDSQHYDGNAADFHILTSVPYRDQITKVLHILQGLQVADRVGLGIYPEWNNKGFHLDVRGTYARWGQINGKYVGFIDALKEA